MLRIRPDAYEATFEMLTRNIDEILTQLTRLQRTEHSNAIPKTSSMEELKDT